MIIAALVLGLVAIWLLVPREGVRQDIAFDPSVLGNDPEVWLQVSEQQYADIRPGAAKRIHWAEGKGIKTPLAIIYVHGFAASAEEIRPVPDEVARALGANLFFTRLSGQGREAEAMLENDAGNWMEDMAEAMAIGRMIGDRVIIIGTSLGGTLGALAASDPQISQGLAGLVLISPAVALHPLKNFLMDAPLPRLWAPFVMGRTLKTMPVNPAHARLMVEEYPTLALIPLGAAMRALRKASFASVEAPLLVFYAKEDRISDSDAITQLTSRWGGSVRIEERRMQAGDDPSAHVIAGDIYSPGQTEDVVALILDWARAEGLAHDQAHRDSAAPDAATDAQ